MERRSVEAIVRALNEAQVRYLVVGGLAVVAHGYVRFTFDFDVVLDLEEQNVWRALAAFQSLGYVPQAPVAIEGFADPALRASWVRDKGMLVFSLRSDLHPLTNVDIFPDNPFDFQTAFASALIQKNAENQSVRFVSLDELLRMKREAGRTKDQLDIEQLNRLHEPDNENN